MGDELGERYAAAKVRPVVIFVQHADARINAK